MIMMVRSAREHLDKISVLATHGFEVAAFSLSQISQMCTDRFELFAYSKVLKLPKKSFQATCK